ncbi:hypothetical protein FGO68_gene3744 [Halteria grandinella]|uniref:Uncharacterized protein n=1 Tax=Halteria grandinella TaxID=5974 RepID=A0A8J8SWC8_HALGN|nr:hypothetical protein FGO68_gene3744 [Halteria grandinella]
MLVGTILAIELLKRSNMLLYGDQNYMLQALQLIASHAFQTRSYRSLAFQVQLLTGLCLMKGDSHSSKVAFEIMTLPVAVDDPIQSRLECEGHFRIHKKSAPHIIAL